MRIKGQNGGEKPNIYLDDGNRRKSVDIEKFAPIGTTWQEVRLPLEAFGRQGIDLTHLEQLQVVFEWEVMSGTIYLDDLAFEASAARLASPRSK